MLDLCHIQWNILFEMMKYEVQTELLNYQRVAAVVHLFSYNSNYVFGSN